LTAEASDAGIGGIAGVPEAAGVLVVAIAGAVNAFDPVVVGNPGAIGEGEVRVAVASFKVSFA